MNTSLHFMAEHSEATGQRRLLIPIWGTLSWKQS